MESPPCIVIIDLEQALIGTPVSGAGKQDAAIQQVVRSFDPCMVWSVY